MTEENHPTASGGEASVAAYSSVIDSAELVEIRLINSNFQALPEAYSSDMENAKKGYKCVVSDTQMSSKKTALGVWIDAEAFCKVGRTKVVSLKCKYLVAYLLMGNPDVQAANAFAQRVGSFAVYPYFRSHFAELTSQAALTLPPLPILKEGKRKIPKSADSTTLQESSSTSSS